MSIVNEYMNDIERELDIFERTDEIENNKISLMLEAVENKLETNYLLADQKVMVEKGTYDDLTYLYMEANKEANKERTGIIQTIKNFIINMKNRVVEFFKKLFKKDIEGEAPEEYRKQVSIINDITGFFNDWSKKIQQGNWMDLADDAINKGITLINSLNVILIGTLKVTDSEIVKKGKEKINNLKLVKYSKGEVKKIQNVVYNGIITVCDKVIDICNKAEENAKKKENENSDETKQVPWVCKKMKELASSARNTMIKWITSFENWLSKTSGNDVKQFYQDDGTSKEPEQSQQAIADKRKAAKEPEQSQQAIADKRKAAKEARDKAEADGRAAENERRQRIKREEQLRRSQGDRDRANKEAERESQEKKRMMNEQMVPELTRECKNTINFLKKYNNSISGSEKKVIVNINDTLKSYDAGDLDDATAATDLYNAINNLEKIIKTHKKLFSTKDYDKYIKKIDNLINKYNTVKESYYGFDDDFDTFFEYVDYDYDEIDEIFTVESTQDRLINEIIDIFEDF